MQAQTRRSATEVAPGVHRFDTDLFNWYVLEDEEGKLTVVDAGFPSHWAALLEGLLSLGRGFGDVGAVVLTHVHADHAGFAERLRRAAGVPVLVHEADLKSSERIEKLPPLGFALNVWRPFVFRLLLKGYASGAASVPGIRGAMPFADGEALGVPGRPRAVHVPGHTAGEVVLHLPERGVLFSGDALVTKDLMTGEDVAPRVPYKYLDDDYGQALRSLDRIGGLGEVVMLPGHGEPWKGDMSAAVASARRAAGALG
jgi:glyoxylase-like metal-dependent hydrolase (beta-lactamase superfamily II)